MDPRARESLTAEFTTEPFEGEGDPPAHALAARDCVVAAGLTTDFGPLGTSVHGDRERVLEAIQAVLRAALDSGADRVTLQITAGGDDDAPGESPAPDGPETGDPTSTHP